MRRRLELLKGKRCWSIGAGEGTGNIFTLGFGAKRRREQPLTNRHLRQEERECEAEYILMVECSWRLEQRGKIVTTWQEPNGNEGPMVKGLERLREKKVLFIKAWPPMNDLEIRFNDGYRLFIFCDLPARDGEGHNWCLETPKGPCVDSE